jgi:hypothetical protein
MAFIEFDLVTFEKSPELILEGGLFVVLTLAANVSANFFNSGLTH